MHYYKHNIGDFALETRGLTFEQIGIFVTLIDRFMATESPLTEEWVNVAFQEPSKSQALALLNAFFAKQDGGWAYEKMANCIKEYKELSEVRRVAGAKGGRNSKKPTTKTSKEGKSSQVPSKCQANANTTINHKPITNNQCKKESNKERACKPDDVDEEVWGDWQQLRKTKKAPITNLVLKNLRREGGKAGMDLDQVMTLQVVNGWQGFKADWVNRDNKRQIGELTQEQRKARGYGYDWANQ